MQVINPAKRQHDAHDEAAWDGYAALMTRMLPPQEAQALLDLARAMFVRAIGDRQRWIARNPWKFMRARKLL